MMCSDLKFRNFFEQVIKVMEYLEKKIIDNMPYTIKPSYPLMEDPSLGAMIYLG